METLKVQSGLMVKEYKPEELAILLTSHPRQQMFWEEGLKTWHGCPHYVLLGYDDVDDSKIKEHVSKFKVDQIFCTGRRSGHVGGELLQMQMGARILADMKMRFPYVLKLCADNTIAVDKLYRLWETVESPSVQG